MKRPYITAILPVVVSLVLVGGCSAGADEDPADSASGTQSVETPSVENEGQTLQDVEVDRGFFTVEVTIPANLFGDLVEDRTEEEIAANAEESGYIDYTMNDDGSVTYVMPRGVYEEALAEMKQSLDVSIEEIVSESPDVFQSITYDRSVTAFDVVVDRPSFEADFAASFVGFTLGITGLFYQIFEGVASDDQEVMIYFIDGATGESFESQRWPLEDS